VNQSRRAFLKTIAAGSGALYLGATMPAFAWADDLPVQGTNEELGENSEGISPQADAQSIRGEGEGAEASDAGEELPEEISWPHEGDNNPSLDIFDVPEDDPNYHEFQHMKEHFATGDNLTAPPVSPEFAEPAEPEPAEPDGQIVPYGSGSLSPVARDGAVLRLAILSDTHSGYWGDLAIQKLKSALLTYRDIAADLDGIFIIGDLTCVNTQAEIKPILEQIIQPLPSIFPNRQPLHLLMGNHDFLGSWSVSAFETTYGRYLRNYQDPRHAATATAGLTADYGQRQNTLVSLKGVPIIKLCPKDSSDNGDYKHLYGFLQQALAAAREQNGDLAKPILVMAHHPMQGLWFEEALDWGHYGVGSSQDMVELLAQYPEVIFFSGHIHNPLQLPQSINQDLGFTAIHTATAGSVFWLKGSLMEHSRNRSQGILLDLFADGTARVTRIEFGLQRYLGTSWVFAPVGSAVANTDDPAAPAPAPAAPDPAAPATAPAAATANAPFLTAPRREVARATPNTGFANLAIQNPTGAFSIRLNQGIKFTDNENAFIYRYRISALNESTGHSLASKYRYRYSDFLNVDMAAAIDLPFDFGLTNGTWHFSVTAINPYDDDRETLTTTINLNRHYLGWIDFPEGRRYYPTRGKAAKGWQKIDKYWYYFSTGKACMLTGWRQVGGFWYYLDPANGRMLTGWQHLKWSGGTSWFYFQRGDSGRMLTGWKKIEGSWYYLRPSTGTALMGWQKIGGLWYYLNSSGRMLTGWQKIDARWYYLQGGDDGHMLTGWQKIGGSWYYLRGGDDGSMVTGWLNLGDQWYYLQGGDSGRMLTGWHKIKRGNSTGWFYFQGGDSGRMLTGWQNIGNAWYYLRPSTGVMLTGWRRIGGVWYYFRGGDDGRMVTGTRKIEGKTYRFDANGALLG
jgi:glucan-binding YG repeat protein